MIKAIVTDIEGTTSALSFVKDVLFPYSRERLPDYVRQHRNEPAAAALLADARRIAAADLSDEALIDTLLRWIDEDRKITPLKALQGMIWEEGFTQGHFTGHIYDDALAQLRTWHASGIQLYVFSSGSIKAQRLLFGHTAHGDLTPLFSGYFDTTIGAKREPAAYERIIAEIGVAPHEILFLSDIREELDAARAAGMKTTWLVRDVPVAPQAAHRQARSFAEIRLD